MHPSTKGERERERERELDLRPRSMGKLAGIDYTARRLEIGLNFDRASYCLQERERERERERRTLKFARVTL